MTPSNSRGRRSGGDPEAHEDDPTGIRDLLSALPDPGPMPQDLVERIEARLAVEQASREQGTVPPGLASRSDAVVDLAAERSHRRPGRTVALLGAAAAGLLVATVAIGELGGAGPSGGPAFDSAAQVPARSAADGAEQDDGAGGSSVEKEQQLRALGQDGSDGAEEAGDLDEALPEDVRVLPALGAVHADDYPDRIAAQAGASVEESGTGGLTPAGALSCWRAAETLRPWTTVHAAQAELAGDRVVVLLGADDPDAGPGEALVLPWACTTGTDVEPLHAVDWPAP